MASFTPEDEQRIRDSVANLSDDDLVPRVLSSTAKLLADLRPLTALSDPEHVALVKSIVRCALRRAVATLERDADLTVALQREGCEIINTHKCGAADSEPTH